MQSMTQAAGPSSAPASPLLLRKALIAAMLAALAGCASVGPDYQRPDTPLPAAWQNAQVTNTAAQGVRLAQWWTRFDDPALNRLIDTALTNSPDIQTARARLRESRARRGLQAVQTAPTLSGRGGTSATDTRDNERDASSDSHKFSAGLDASWEIDIFGGQRRALEAADATLAASEADLNATRVSLAAEAATTYISLRTNEIRLAVARANLASREQTLQLTQWRNEARLVSGLEVNQARSSVEQTRASIPSLQRSMEEDRLSLALLLGLQAQQLNDILPSGERPALPGAANGVASGPVTSEFFNKVPSNIATGIPADTLRQRPDVAAAERRLAAQTAQIGVAHAARYPSLKLSGSLGVEALSLGGLLRADTLVSSLAASLAAPVFDAGRITQNIEIQNAVQEQTLVAYRRAVNQALIDVEKALNAWVRSNERLQILQVAADSAREAARLASIRFQAGQTDLLTQLDTQRTQLTQEDQLASAQGDRLVALVQLYKALGGGWEGADQAPGATPTGNTR